MALIKNKNLNSKKQIKIKIDEKTLKQIEQYCEWSGIFDLGYFFEKASDFVFKKDLEWKLFKKGKLTTDA
ncbi:MULTISPECIES: hypothetical protein [Legionella]|uniref:Uncharacterized protein n=1 Tax=Legionella maceachernii TaxID=466 RepID=A0A0W0WE39_9GAMM|nr:hypothetical protein [Legionella maceachernii]KTD30584.1 hypothetical protein Lmac_0528 [Legionella maceachernii]SJZ97596.1 hypothetical protein SAMN02745128_01617 [Legionella maceachernii]SUP01081.1 Uncharacterised protein [Legionella maceachernii]